MVESSKIYFFYSKAMLVYYLVICIIFVAFGAWSLIFYPVIFIVIGFWGLLPSIPGIFWAISQIIKESPRIIISGENIEYVEWPFKILKWENIRSAYLRTLPSKGFMSTFLVFETDNEIELLKTVKFIDRILWKSGKIFGLSPIIINLTNIDVVPEKILEIILANISKVKNLRDLSRTLSISRSSHATQERKSAE